MSADADKQLDAMIDIAARVFAEPLDEGAEAIAKIAEIEAIIDDLIAKLPTSDPAAPWDALTAIKQTLRKVLR